MKWLRDFIELFFPKACCICGNPLVGDEKELCLHCLLDLPSTHISNGSTNFVEARFRGRVPVVAATALFIFKRGNSTQELLHQIKYYGNERLALQMGRMMGSELANNRAFDSVDCVIPVPLHKKKIRSRGYNQSFLLCQGISETFHRPVIADNLVRTQHTETQTHKTREERLDNMRDVFAVTNAEQLKGHHILLIDDVITTGATTEACWNVLKNIEGLSISIAALAITGDT